MNSKFELEYKKAFEIRKVEEFFLEMFRQGRISGTVHTCVGQEFTGVFAAKYSNYLECNSIYLLIHIRIHFHRMY
jgi:TPP-dependent pyruvate/acetoin dehydrogenase alpha subunit